MTRKRRSRARLSSADVAGSAPPPAPSRASDTAVRARLATWGVLAASLAIGGVALLQFSRSPFFRSPVVDESGYWEWAKTIAGGDVLGQQAFYQDPLYPYAVAAVIAVVGESLTAVRVLQVLAGTASLAIIAWTARRLLGSRRAWLAPALAAAYHGLYFFELQVEKSTLVVLCSALSCAMGVAAAERGSKRWFFATGLSVGLLALLRGNFLLLLPLVLGWAALVRRDGKGAALARAGVLALGAACVVAPVTARNLAVAGELVVTTSQAGANFYIGNSAVATGRYVQLPFVRSMPPWEAKDFEREAERRAGRDLSPREVSRYWSSEALAWIRSEPAAALRLLLHKARLTLSDYEIPDNYNFYVTRDLFVGVLWLPILGFGVLWGPAVLGAVALVRRDRRAWYPALFMVAYAATLPLFFLVDRYRMPLVAPMALFAAAGVWHVVDAGRAGARGSLAGMAAFLVASWIIGFAPTRESRTPPAVEYFLLGNAYVKTGDAAAALPWYERAIAARPHRADFRLARIEALREVGRLAPADVLAELRRTDLSADDLFRYGRELERLGRTRDAEAAHERATTADPEHAGAHGRLGFLLADDAQTRDPARAREHLQRALELRPDDPTLMKALGSVAYSEGDFESARAWWKRVLAVDPTDAATTSNLELLESAPPATSEDER